MQIDLTGHHCDITPAMKSHVDEKFERITRHFDRVTDVHVILSVEKQGHKAEATIHVSGNKLFASAEMDDMYAAIDSMVDKLDRQIIKHKQKKQDHRGNPVPADPESEA